ncbi:hypothetical protein DLM76_16960 [Leptospira yasudae]|nr:hypothetical protein DLM76_16960 [Leptospira yasudae]
MATARRASAIEMENGTKKMGFANRIHLSLQSKMNHDYLVRQTKSESKRVVIGSGSASFNFLKNESYNFYKFFR